MKVNNMLIFFILNLFLNLQITAQNAKCLESVDDITHPPKEIYNTFCKLFDEHYVLFEEKEIDWESIKNIYSSLVKTETSEDELYTIFCNMIQHLNDNHVGVIRNDSIYCYSGILSNLRMNDFSEKLILSKYLKNNFKSRMKGVITYGWLADSVGYIYLKSFPGDYIRACGIIDSALVLFERSKGLILDVRNNDGGNDLFVQRLANRFTDKKRLFMISKIKKGPLINDYTNPRYWQIEPEGESFYKPVVLLTHRFSVSSAENLAMAMKAIPTSRIIGDFTSGVFGGACPFILPNGWKVNITFMKIVDYKEQCWEGIGVIPDIFQQNSMEEIQNNQDKTLELAIDVIQSNIIKKRTDKRPEENIKLSLSGLLYESLHNLSENEAINKFRKLASNLSDSSYLCVEEMWLIGDQLLEEDMPNEAEAVLDLIFELFPQDWSLSPTAPMWWYYIYYEGFDFKYKIYRKAIELTPDYIWQQNLREAAEAYFNGMNDND